MPENLSPFVALITGASRGIGRAIALGLAGAGAHIVGSARSISDLESLGDEVEALDRRFLAVPADLGDLDAIRALVEEAWAWQEQIDILVNAAGMIVRAEPPDVDPADFDRLFAVNVRAPFFLTQQTGALMLERGTGSIVNITSLAGEVVTSAPIMYQASKAALIQMTRGFAQRWGPTVRVNAIAPGYIDTSLNREWLESDENRRLVEEKIAMGRLGEPADIVGAVLFLASPGSEYITGQNIRIDGGWNA